MVVLFWSARYRFQISSIVSPMVSGIENAKHTVCISARTSEPPQADFAPMLGVFAMLVMLLHLSTHTHHLCLAEHKAIRCCGEGQ